MEKVDGQCKPIFISKKIVELPRNDGFLHVLYHHLTLFPLTLETQKVTNQIGKDRTLSQTISYKSVKDDHSVLGSYTFALGIKKI